MDNYRRKLWSRQLRNRAASCGIVLSAESQLKDLEALVEDCRSRRHAADDADAAKLGNVEVVAHKLIALLRMEAEKPKPQSEAASLTDEQLHKRKLELVKELSK